MKVLLCFDETEASERVAEPARAIARDMKDEVHLLQVIVPVAGDVGEAYSGSEHEAKIASDREFERWEPAARKRLERLGQTFAAPVEVAVISDRNPARVIIRYVEEHGIDLVGLTTHAAEPETGNDHLGDVAEEVTLSGVAPVLLSHVPHHRELGDRAFSPGMFVFTADGVELGTVARAGANEFSISTGTGELVLPRSAAAEVEGGRLRLYWDNAMVTAEMAR